MTIKTIKSFDAACSDSVQSVAAKRLKTEMEIVVLLEGDKVRFAAPEQVKGKHSTYSSTTQYVELRTMVSDLRGIGFNSVTQHSEIKKAYGSSTDKKHSLTKEHESNRTSSSVTPAPGDDSVQYQTSRVQSDSADKVSTSCFSIKGKRKCIAPLLKKFSHTHKVSRKRRVTAVASVMLGVGIFAVASAEVAGVVIAIAAVAAVVPLMAALVEATKAEPNDSPTTVFSEAIVQSDSISEKLL